VHWLEQIQVVNENARWNSEIYLLVSWTIFGVCLVCEPLLKSQRKCIKLGSCINVTLADLVDPHAVEICFKAVAPAICSLHIAGEADVGRMRACHKKGVGVGGSASKV
jgi:hypothetical protein